MILCRRLAAAFHYLRNLLAVWRQPFISYDSLPPFGGFNNTTTTTPTFCPLHRMITLPANKKARIGGLKQFVRITGFERAKQHSITIYQPAQQHRYLRRMQGLLPGLQLRQQLPLLYQQAHFLQQLQQNKYCCLPRCIHG
jgi:hypothetical protein